MQQLLRFETKSIRNESHDCFRDALVCTDTKNVIVAFTYICKIRGKLHAHARAREQKFKQNCNLEMLFLFFFFFLNISLSWCHDNASLAKPRRSLILHVTRALISFEPIFFFFLKKEKEDLILLIRLMKREMRTVKILRLEESIIIEHDWTRKISIFVYLSLEFL